MKENGKDREIPTDLEEEDEVESDEELSPARRETERESEIHEMGGEQKCKEIQKRLEEQLTRVSRRHRVSAQEINEDLQEAGRARISEVRAAREREETAQAEREKDSPAVIEGKK